MSLAPYLKTLGVGLQDTFVYRWNFLLRSLFGIAPLFASVFVWRAICDSHGNVQTYSFPAMVTYFVAVLVVENLATPTEDEWRIAAEIRDGHISSLLIKPIDYLLYRFSLFVSYRLLYTLITFPVIALILWLLRANLQFPTHLSTWLLFALAVLGSALLQFFIAYSVAMLAFWFLEVSTLIFFLYSFEYFLSGHVFPIDLLPPTLRAIVHWTPFPYELFFPIQVLQERLSSAALVEDFGIQWLWITLTALLAKHLWKRGIHHYQAVGG